jgi:hypothetical protein
MKPGVTPNKYKFLALLLLAYLSKAEQFPRSGVLEIEITP